MSGEFKELEITDKKMAKLDTIQKGVGEIVMELSAITVKNEVEYAHALSSGKKAKSVMDDIEDARKEINKPYSDFVSKVNDTAKAISTPIKLALEDMKAKMVKFNNDQEAKRQKEADKERLKQLELQKKLETTDTAKQATRIESQIVRSQEKVSDLKNEKDKNADKVRKFEIITANQVPREFCEPSEKLIRAKVGAPGSPIVDIPGVKIWDDVKVVLR